MQFGIHLSGERPGRGIDEVWAEDLIEVLTADKLGFQEGWVREHEGWNGPMPAPNLFICKAFALTQQIRLGPEAHLPYHHPVQLATEAAVCDHLSDGRYMLGFGSGGGPNPTQMRQLGIGDNSERAPRSLEAIDLILRCFREAEPFDFDGKFWHGSGIDIIPKPLQQPHVPLAINSSNNRKSVEVAGAQGLMPLFFDYDGPRMVRELVDVFLDFARAASREPDRSAVRVCRYVYVTDSVTAAKEELRESTTPHIERDKAILQHHFDEYLPPSGRVEDVTFDSLVDANYYFIGDPDTVFQQIRAFYDEVGGFGVLLLRCGTDRATRDQRGRSMSLFMEQVAPRLAELTPG